MDELIDRLLREELRVVNKHLPRRRISICELLDMEVPHVVTSDGSTHIFDPRELDLLARLSNRNCLLKLPIIIEFIPQNEGVYVIRDPLEAEIIAEILGVHKVAPMVLYRSTVLELRRKLRTTSTVLLSPGSLI